ncbi:MAG: cyclic nucleotide-binding domain-containing protein [Micavibrio sp.]|nr:cyclic nucleotide-binding domain-containing protein [Micavibrio sp.]
MPEKAVEVFIEDLLRRQRLRKKDTPDENAALFQGLSDTNLQTLLSNSRMNEFRSGHNIVQQGDTPGYLYYIMNGSIKTLRHGTDGQESTIRMLQSGDTFMDAVIFMGGSSPVSVKTLEDSRILMIPAEAVRRHALHDSQFACNLLKIVTKHYKSAIQQIDSIVIKNPIERLGYYFLQQHLEQGSESLEVALPFQKSTIANHLGMKPETFSRALSQIKKMGINVDQEKLSLRDAYVLCHFCDPDTAQDCPQFNTEKCPLTPGGPCGSGRKSCH